jgi:hypothetical protein
MQRQKSHPRDFCAYTENEDLKNLLKSIPILTIL